MQTIQTLSNQKSLEKSLDKMESDIIQNFKDHVVQFFRQIKSDINEQFERLQTKKKIFDLQLQRDIEDQISLIYKRVDYFKIHMHSYLMYLYNYFNQFFRSLQYQNPLQFQHIDNNIQSNEDQYQNSNLMKSKNQQVQDSQKSISQNLQVQESEKSVARSNQSFLNYQEQQLTIEIIDDDFLVDLQFSSDELEISQTKIRKAIISDSEEVIQKQDIKNNEQQQEYKQEAQKQKYKEVFLIDDNQSRMLFQLAALPVEQNQPQFPYQGPDKQITEIGESTITNIQVSTKQKDIQVIFYTWADLTSWRYLPIINRQMKLRAKKQEGMFKYLDVRMHKQNFLSVIGWVFPQDLKDLPVFHEITQQFEKRNLCGSIKNLYDGRIVIIPYKILIQNQNFKDFQIPKPFVLSNKSKDYYLSKLWGQVHSELCFIYYVKDTTQSSVFGYNFIQGQNQEIVKNTSLIERWISKQQQEKEVRDLVKTRIQDYKKIQKRIQKSQNLKQSTTSKER